MQYITVSNFKYFVLIKWTQIVFFFFLRQLKLNVPHLSVTHIFVYLITSLVSYAGAHSVGRTHCMNLVQRLYPTVDPTLDPQYAEYLKGRCPTPNPDPKAVLYARNDRETPMILDNMYYKNLLGNMGLLIVDQQLASDPTTYPYVEKFAADNGYFQDQFAKAVLLLSENNPLTGDDGEIRKDCRYVNI